VLAVVLYHFAPGLASGGFFGVDLFFVLSGFLITGLLLQELDDTGAVSFARFYQRRALRLLPALVVACVLVVVLTVFRPGPGAYPLLVVLAAVVFYFGNWIAATQGTGLGYFGHTWSLAIEEQFYLLWPVSLVRMARRPDRLVRRIAAVALVLALARAVLYVTWHHNTGLRDWSILAGDELLAGAAAAALLWHRRGAIRVHSRLVVTAVAVLLLMAVTMHTDSGALFVGGYLVFAVAAAVLVTHLATEPGSSVGRLLSLPPLVAIGRVSYGLYLFHYPIFVYLQRTSLSLPEQLLLGYCTTAALTVGSWWLVERPFLRLKPRSARPDGPGPPAMRVP
jgi:peptidoglycan/LPS O-acetylase OafA/YrhL